MAKTKRFILATLLSVVAVFCFSTLAFSNRPVKADQTPQSYELVAGTSTEGLYAGATNSSETPSAVGYSANKQTLYINSFLNGKYAVIAFPEIDTSVYKYIDVLLYKNVNYGVTLSFFKNDSSYTSTSVAQKTYEFNNLGGVDFKDYVRVDLTDIADANGKISSFILRHESSDTETESSGFQISILSAKVQPIVDYTLKINGVDLVSGMAQGSEFITSVVHTDTNKIYANGFSRGKAVSLKFGTPISVADYKTLQLNVAFNGISTPTDYYLKGYKYGTTNLSQVEPNGRYYVANVPALNNQTNPNVVTFDLDDYANANGIVEGIVLMHYSDSRADNFENLSLFVFESKVLIAETTKEVQNWQNEILGLEHKKVSNSESDLTFTFNETISKVVTELTVDANVENEFLSKVLVNGTALNTQNVSSITVFDKKATLKINGVLNNDGSDQIVVQEDGSLTVDCVKHVFSKAFNFEINQVLSNGESANYLPVMLDYTLLINGLDVVDGEKPLGAKFIKLLTDAPKKLYANAFTRGSAVSLKFATPIDSAVYKTLELRLCLYGLSTPLTYYFEGYRYGVTDISKETPSAKFYIENNPEINSKDKPFTVNVPLQAFADSDGLVRGIILYHLYDNRDTDTELLNLFVYESYVKKAESQANHIKSWKTEIDGISYNKGSNGIDKIIVDFDTELFSDANTDLVIDQAFLQGVVGCINVNGGKIGAEKVLSAVGGYDGKLNSLAISVSGVIDNDGNDIIQINKGVELTVAYSNDTTTRFFTTGNSEYIFSRVINAGETLVLGLYSYVTNVYCDYTDAITIIEIEFNIPVGDIDGFNPKEKLFIDGKKLSDYDQITCSVSTNTSILEVKIPNSLGVLSSSGNSKLTIKSGFAVGKIFINKDCVYSQTSANSNYWFVESDIPLYVLWVDNFNINSVYASFSIKLSSEYVGEDVYGFDIVTFDKIIINGKKLSDILLIDDGAVVILRGSYLDVYISATGYDHCFTLSGSDKITVEDGFAVPYGGKVNCKSEFVYNALWEEFEHVRDISEIEDRIINLNVRAVETDKAGKDYTSLMVTFSEPISFRFFPYAHRHVADLSTIMQGFPTSNPSDIYLSQMAKYGILDSVLTNIVYDGKTLAEWIEYDKRTSTDWRNSIDVRFLGPSLGFEDRIQIFFYPNSSALMDDQKSHTLEIKEGFITPNLQRVDKSVTYVWDVLNERWVGINSVNSDLDTSKTDGGCSSAMAESVWVLSITTLLSACCFIAVRKIFKTKKGDDNV